MTNLFLYLAALFGFIIIGGFLLSLYSLYWNKNKKAKDINRLHNLDFNKAKHEELNAYKSRAECVNED